MASKESVSSSCSSSILSLARSLGAVRSRKVCNRSSGSGLQSGRKGESDQQVFSSLIVLDFEATCWPDKKNSAPSEIIEFPAVLLDTSTGSLLDEFHTYVMPTEHPKLSDFCRQLTGIEQGQVDAGVPLPTCLHLFKRWINKITDQHKLIFNDIQPGRKSATFVTW